MEPLTSQREAFVFGRICGHLSADRYWMERYRRAAAMLRVAGADAYLDSLEAGFEFGANGTRAAAAVARTRCSGPRSILPNRRAPVQRSTSS